MNLFEFFHEAMMETEFFPNAVTTIFFLSLSELVVSVMGVFLAEMLWYERSFLYSAVRILYSKINAFIFLEDPSEFLRYLHVEHLVPLEYFWSITDLRAGWSARMEIAKRFVRCSF